MSDQIYYSVAEVAERYRVTTRTVARWIEQGLLPGAQKKAPLRTSPYEIPEEALEHFETMRKSETSSSN